jgi:hypothetical protein
VTLLRYDAVEQNEAHHAADIHEDDGEYERGYNQNSYQAG